MVNPSDLLPSLEKYCNIIYDYLRKHLTEEQIDDYLNYFHSNNTTRGEAYRCITEQHGHPDTIFYALDSLGRINALCAAVDCPINEQLSSEQAFFAVFSALQAGMTLGAVIDNEGRQALIALAKRGEKFVNAGRHEDELTHYLISLFHEFYESKGRYPRNKEVLSLIESREGQGFIHTVSDESIEWGHSGETKINTLPNRLTGIRKKLEKKITVIGKP